MLKSKKDHFILLARVLLSAIFLFSAFSKFSNIPDTVAYMQAAGLGGGALLAWVAALVEGLAALALLTGFYADRAAFVLVLYLLPVTYFFHFEPGEGMQTFHLLKNLAIMGGLLQVTACGGGRYAFRS